jgi:hypothetical protein
MRLAVRLGMGTALVAAALNAAVLAAPAAHAAASVQVFQQEFEISNFPAVLPLQGSCVNGGSGEVILINGTLHFVAVVTTDAAGGMHVALNQNFSDVTGVGTISGDTYRVTDTVGLQGPGREALYVPPGSALPRTDTEHSDIRFISIGSGDNLLGQISSHLTINANGDVTVDSVTFELLCVG